MDSKRNPKKNPVPKNDSKNTSAPKSNATKSTDSKTNLSKSPDSKSNPRKDPAFNSSPTRSTTSQFSVRKDHSVSDQARTKKIKKLKATIDESKANFDIHWAEWQSGSDTDESESHLSPSQALKLKNLEKTVYENNSVEPESSKKEKAEAHKDTKHKHDTGDKPADLPASVNNKPKDKPPTPSSQKKQPPPNSSGRNNQAQFNQATAKPLQHESEPMAKSPISPSPEKKSQWKESRDKSKEPLQTPPVPVPILPNQIEKSQGPPEEPPIAPDTKPQGRRDSRETSQEPPPKPKPAPKKNFQKPKVPPQAPKVPLANITPPDNQPQSKPHPEEPRDDLFKPLMAPRKESLKPKPVKLPAIRSSIRSSAANKEPKKVSIRPSPKQSMRRKSSEPEPVPPFIPRRSGRSFRNLSNESLQASEESSTISLSNQPELRRISRFGEEATEDESGSRRKSVYQKFLSTVGLPFKAMLHFLTEERRAAGDKESDELLKAKSTDTVKGEISSDDDADNLSAEEEHDEQLDSEWLELDNDLPGSRRKSSMKGKERRSTYNSVDETLQYDPKVKREFAIRKSVFQYPERYLNSMKPIYMALLIIGRFPFQIEHDSDDQQCPRYYFKRDSWRYRIFYGTTVFFMTSFSLMLFGYTQILYFQDPYTLHESLIILDRDKYWLEGLLNMFNMFFLTVAGVTWINYGNGYLLSDFFNRWSYCMSMMHYDVTSGIKPLIIAFFIFNGLYVVTFVSLFFFGGEFCPTPRGACGFTGLLYFYAFIPFVRLRKVYRFVEIFGLIAHLYTTLATGLILLLIAAHCWALKNSAKRFNNRLAACLRGAEFNEVPASPEERKSAPPGAPYKKLFAEHLVVTSFVKQMGKIFSTTLLVFLAIKLAEMVLTVYCLAEPIVDGYREPADGEKYFDLSKNISYYNLNETVPVLLIEPSHVNFLKNLLYSSRAWLGWFVFMEIVQSPGATILQGAGLVVKHYYIQCKTSHALRFISSMKFSYSERLVFHLNPGGIQLKRSFMALFAGFAIMNVVTMLQFKPSMSAPKDVVICDRLGYCTIFRFPPKLYSSKSYKKTIGKDIVNQFLKPPPPLSQERKQTLAHFRFPPCLGDGRLPHDFGHTKNYAYECYYSGSPKPRPTFIPSYFELSKDGKWYHQLPPNVSLGCAKPTPSTEVDIKNKRLVNCFGTQISKIESDECGNPFIGLPKYNTSLHPTNPTVIVVKFESSDVFCCFEYPGALKSQGQSCNLDSLSKEAQEHRCKRKSEGDNNRAAREKYIAKYWSSSNDPGMNAHWAKCLCPGIGGIVKDAKACDNLLELPPPTQPPPTSPAAPPTRGSPTTTQTPTTTTTPTLKSRTPKNRTRKTSRPFPTTPMTTRTPTTTKWPKITTTTLKPTTTEPGTIKPWSKCDESKWPEQYCNLCPDPRRLFSKNYIKFCTYGQLAQSAGSEYLMLSNVYFDETSPQNTLNISLQCRNITGLYLGTKPLPPQTLDCYGNKFDKFKSIKDDCGNYPQSFPSAKSGVQLTPVAKADIIRQTATGVFEFVCCWDYSQWRDPNTVSICDLPPKDYIFKHFCIMRDLPSEESAQIFCASGMFAQNNFNTLYAEKCDDDDCRQPALHVASYRRYRRRPRATEFQYLPCPSVVTDIETFRSSKIVTTCPNGREIFAYLDEDLYITQLQDCESPTSFSLNTGGPVRDCYGFVYEEDELLDDCGIPGFITPPLRPNYNSFYEAVYPVNTFVRINESSYVCCWKFGAQSSDGCAIVGDDYESTCAIRQIPEKYVNYTSFPHFACDYQAIFSGTINLNRYYKEKCPVNPNQDPDIKCNQKLHASNDVQIEEQQEELYEL